MYIYNLHIVIIIITIIIITIIITIIIITIIIIVTTKKKKRNTQLNQYRLNLIFFWGVALCDFWWFNRWDVDVFLFQDGFNHVFCRPYDNGLFPGSCEIGMAIELGGSWRITKKIEKAAVSSYPKNVSSYPKKDPPFFMGKSTINGNFHGNDGVYNGIWVNYNDRALFSLTIIIVSEGNHPKMAELFRWTWNIIIYPE